jgi:DNA-binding PadR family transcriptional regulator
MKQSTGRIKKSYSISKESEQFVRRIRKVRHIASDSEALDQLLRESMAAHSRSAMDAAYRAYYDSASEAELADENVWAELSGAAMTELAK